MIAHGWAIFTMFTFLPISKFAHRKKRKRAKYGHFRPRFSFRPREYPVEIVNSTKFWTSTPKICEIPKKKKKTEKTLKSPNRLCSILYKTKKNSNVNCTLFWQVGTRDSRFSSLTLETSQQLLQPYI